MHRFYVRNIFGTVIASCVTTFTSELQHHKNEGYAQSRYKKKIKTLKELHTNTILGTEKKKSSCVSETLEVGIKLQKLQEF